MNNGWVKIHRKFIEWEWYSDPNTMRLFIHLLFKATHKPIKWKNIQLNSGQMVTGRKVLSEELRLSEQEIRTSLNKLKSTNEITIKSTNRFSIVTVCNWRVYQIRDQQQQITNKPTETLSSNQQSTTYKNEKNNKNNIYVIFEAFRASFPGKKRGGQTELENFLKKNNPETVHLLLPALEREKEYRAKSISEKLFVPPWKNLSTWINKHSWETEFPEVIPATLPKFISPPQKTNAAQIISPEIQKRSQLNYQHETQN